MSIAIALGVTTPETPYTDMAAGSDPESVEATPAVNEKTYSNHSYGSAQSHGYRGLPYADHNYGAPPPPTPPASPLSQTIIPRLELNGGLGCRRPRFHTNDPDNSADSESSSEEEGVVPAHWCQCRLMDGYVIKCESCRGLDRRKALDGPRRKQDNVSVGESSATESGDEEVSAATVSYTATQHTPTSITLTVNRVKRSKAKKRKKSTEKTRATPKAKKVKAFREGSRKSLRMKNSTSEASVLDENTAEGWETRIRQWTDQYEEALANQYSADVQTLLQLHRSASKSSPSSPALTMDTINRTELACNNTVLSSQMQLQLGRVTRVQKHRKILRAARDLEPDTLIIEYRGKVMLKQQFEVNGHFFKKPYPFVLFYSKFNEVEMCVDARTFGNDARFIRRSCTPNAEVRHMIAEGMIHLCIYAVTQISKDSEVTIGFDYEFNSCNYKVECACHKGNQNCPVQKHNQSPPETLLPPRQNPIPALPGAETRRRRARRRELEGSGVIGSVSEDSNQPLDEPGEAHGASDAEDALVDGLKQEDGQEDVDEIGALLPNRRSREDRKAEAIMHVFENLEKRRKRVSQGTERGDDPKQEGVEPEEGVVSSPNPGAANAGVVGGVSTRRTSFASDAAVASLESDRPPSAPKPPPARSSKPRPKSRISRYRSGSAQRARRQRQAQLAQQTAEAGAAGGEEGGSATGPGEPGPGDGTLGPGQPLDGDGSGVPSAAPGSKASVRYPKTKKYLVTEWLNDKAPERVEEPVERPLRISTDPTVLATTLNMLPGLAHSPLICTAPKHYVRFGSPFNPERRRRPLTVDPAYGSCKKRWIKQALDESMSSGSVEDGTNSTSSHQSDGSTTTCFPSRPEVMAPFKKRKSKYAAECAATPADLLLRPLSPISPPLPCEPSLSALHPLHPLLGAEEERQNGSLLPYSPLTSLSASRCNTPLQFENISSPEASPVYQPESLSPEPCLQPDFDTQRISVFPELSMTSSLGSPTLVSDDFGLAASDPLGGCGGGPSLTPAPVSNSSEASLSLRSSEAQAREQVFRTEFNLIYTCSPLNANLTTGPATDRRLSQSEGSFSPAESYFSNVSGQGLLGEAGSGSLSPYPEPHFGSGTPPHTSNPPQKKKVSLLEYRKRKQGARDPEPGSSMGTPTRPSSLCPSAESPGGPRSLLQHPASPHSSFSSPAHQAFPQIEEVSPPDLSTSVGNHTQAPAPRGPDSSQWMVPTSVERLREGQGVLERVLRGNLKMERVLKRSDGGANEHGNNRDKDPDGVEGGGYDPQSSSPMRSPQRYSPSVHPHQMQPHLSESHQHLESPAYHQQRSSSPFGPSFSSSPSSSSSTVGQSYHPSRLGTPTPLPHDALSTSAPPPSVDSRPTGGALHHSSSGAGGMDLSHLYSGSHLKAGVLNSSLSGSVGAPSRGQGHPKTDSGACHGSRLAQAPTVQSLKPGSPGQAVLQTSSRLLPATGAQHYPQRHLQQPPMQGSGVRTQSGTY